jgi:hypothetical protein
MTLRRTVIAAVVAVVLVAILGGHGPNDPSSAPGGKHRSGRAGVPAPARVVDEHDVPELQEVPAQRDIDPRSRTARRYRRTHRLVSALPLTARGVTFTLAGRTRDGRRILVHAQRNGISSRIARRAFRDLVDRRGDPPSTYHLTVDPNRTGATP